MVPQNKAEVLQEDTKARLIKTARKLFAERGFDGTTVREIVEEAGVNLSLVSYHFKGKEGLYRSCIMQHIQSKSALVEQLLSQPPTTCGEFKFWLSMFIKERLSPKQEDFEMARIFHREFGSQNSTVSEIFRENFAFSHRQLVEFLKQGQEGGWLQRTIEPDIIASFILGGTMHMSIAGMCLGSSWNFPLEVMTESLVSILMSGIAQAEAGARLMDGPK